MPARQIPSGLDAQVGLYRSLLAGRRMLIVLDNARDANQVRPLLPGTAGCLALVTSRSQLAGLGATHGAHVLTLDLLSADEARQFLTQRLGEGRTKAEPAAVTEIIARCVGLPLALAVVAARVVARPGMSLRAVADELGDTSSLDSLADLDGMADVRTVLSCSYHALNAAPARLFRLLGVHPGPDFTLPAMANLAGTPTGDARHLLAELAQASLLVEHRPGRYTLHDLLRAYTVELSQSNSGAERREALNRLLNYYLHAAYAGDRLLCPHRDPVALSTDVCEPTSPERFNDQTQALDWFVAEHEVLLATVERAAVTGFDAHAWDLAWAIVGVLRRRGLWRALVDTQTIALDAARRLGDRAMQARSHRTLANSVKQLGRVADAHTHLASALELHKGLNDPVNEGHTHYAMSDLYDDEGNYEGAVSSAHRALHLFEAAGYLPGQADTLNSIGLHHYGLGDYHEALTWCRKALALARYAGGTAAEAAALDSMAAAHHHLGHKRQAIRLYLRSLRLCRDIHDAYNEAFVLDHLGDTYVSMGDRQKACAAWRQSAAILEELGDPNGAHILAKVDH